MRFRRSGNTGYDGGKEGEKGGSSVRRSIRYHDRKIRAQERAHSALLTLFHLVAPGRKITAGVHLLGSFQNFGRAKFYADPATLTIPFFYVKLGHIDSILSFFGGPARREARGVKEKQTSFCLSNPRPRVSAFYESCWNKCPFKQYLRQLSRADRIVDAAELGNTRHDLVNNNWFWHFR